MAIWVVLRGATLQRLANPPCLRRASAPRLQLAAHSTRSASNQVQDTGALAEGVAESPGTLRRCLSIVTGASRGLGAAIARALVTNGPPLPGAAPSPTLQSGESTTRDQNKRRSSPWTHDVVLLASDAHRLGTFVRTELEPLLQHRQIAGQWQQPDTVHSRKGSATAALAAPAPIGAEAAATQWPTGTCDTRIHTLCFDLGDMHALHANTDRLLSTSASPVPLDTSPTPPTGQRGVATEDSAAAGSPVAVGDTAGAVAAGPGGAELGVRGCDAEAGPSGVLPLPPSAYSHVLLIHNAGQVGDLVPVELQTLANIRRQTDLNVTSFVHLTAAVLRTFLYAPLADPQAHVGDAPAAELQAQQAIQHGVGQLHKQREASKGPGAAACGSAAEASASGACSASSRPSVPTAAAAQPPRRTITVVNISSVSVDQPYEHFSLYGMGKAARHMIIRSVAHEAALREAGVAAAPSEASGTPGGTPGAAAPASCSGHPEAAAGAAPASVRALSYAPGAIDTEMQASAREALPAGRLKESFEENARTGRLVNPRVSASVLYDILARDAYDNGAHMDYYSASAGSAATASHPLARGDARADA